MFKIPRFRFQSSAIFLEQGRSLSISTNFHSEDDIRANTQTTRYITHNSDTAQYSGKLCRGKAINLYFDIPEFQFWPGHQLLPVVILSFLGPPGRFIVRTSITPRSLPFKPSPIYISPVTLLSTLHSLRYKQLHKISQEQIQQKH